jgi:hypothetical protein
MAGMKSHTTLRAIAIVFVIAIGTTYVAADGPAGRITFPEEGSCHGPAAVPVQVIDDFGGALQRSYRPLPWSEVRLVPSDAASGDSFGDSVALGDGFVAGGAPGHDANGSSSGAVWVFEPDSAGWTQRPKLLPIVSGQGYDFGRSLAAWGPRLMVGAPGGVFLGRRMGRAYLFERGPLGWFEFSGPTALDGSSGDRFGFAVGVHDEVLAVGAFHQGGGVGSLYLYRRVSRWPQQKIARSYTFEQFGSAVDIDGDVMVVGAWQDRVNRVRSGTASVFRGAPGFPYLEEAKLLPVNPRTSDDFGWSASVSGDTIVVGAPYEEFYSHGEGRAFVYRYDGVGWTLEQELRAPDRTLRDQFGYSVAVEGDVLAVGARSEGSFSDDGRAGAVYVYRRDGSLWVPERKLFPSTTTRAVSRFGDSVALRGGRIAVGAPNDDLRGDRRGAIYVYEPVPEGDPPSYRLHGDHVVTLEVTDEAGRMASDAVSFTIDLDPPSVDLLRPRRDTILVEDTPFDIVFESDEDDLAAGGVIHEVVTMEGCPIYDGADYGDGDGLLSDETLVVDRSELCRISDTCGFDLLEDVTLVVEVTDCGGNVGRAGTTYRGGPLRLRTESCTE